MMQTCERNLGQQFLAGTLKRDQEDRFSQHIAVCDRCRRWLEEDSGDRVTWELAKGLSLAPTIDADGTRSGQTECFQSVGSGSLHDCQQTAKQIVGYLAPSDDPRYLGRLGSYEVAGVIGRGGMGIVLKAFEPSLNRFVAIKILEPSLVSIGSARQRFAREARAMAAIAHENVVPVYAVDQYRDLPYFVMEYVVGGTLEHRLAKEGTLEVASIVRIAMQIADALAAADQQGLVHRDIKPGNILLDRGTERVRVADFGLARVACEASDTRSGMIAGTPQYMSPEQVKGVSIDARSDLFSLGSVMYAMCTGHSPFRADGVYAVMQRIVHDDPRSIRQQNPSIPDWLQAFVLRLLCKSPASRFMSASNVAEELRTELAHLQNPTKVKQPLRAWMDDSSADHSELRSHRQKLGVFALVSILVLGLLSWSVARQLFPSNEARNANTAVSAVGSERPNSKTTQAAKPLEIDASALLWENDGFHGLQKRIEEFRANTQIVDMQSNAERNLGVLDETELNVLRLKSQIYEFGKKPF